MGNYFFNEFDFGSVLTFSKYLNMLIKIKSKFYWYLIIIRAE